MSFPTVLSYSHPYISGITAYAEWAKSAIPKLLSPPLKEFRAYRGAVASDQVLIIYEFEDISAWAEWWGREDLQKLWSEAYSYAVNISSELWGPSPFVPEPLRPK